MSKVNVANFLKELAEKAGVDANDAALVDVLAHTELNRIELPGEITGAINRSLLSITDAKNNHPAIKTHYFAEVMSNVDRALERVYKELNLEQDVIEELNAESSSTKRIALLGTKLNGIIDAKEQSAGKKPSEAVASLNATINDLNEKLRLEKEQRAQDNASNKQKMDSFRKNLALQSKSGTLKTIYDELPAEVRFTTIDTLLNKELQDNNATFVLEEDGSLKLQKKDGSNYFDENNRQIGVDDFINKTLAKHKVLKQSGTPPAGSEQQNNGVDNNANNGQPARVAGGQNAKVNMGSLIEESLNGLNSTSSPMI